LLFSWCSGNIPAIVFDDNPPSSDTLMDLVEDTAQTAWQFPIISRAKHTEGQHTASKTQENQCMQREIQAFSTAKIFLLGRRFSWQVGKCNETRDFFFSLRFLTFSAFPHPTCSCNKMFYFACRAYARILFNGCLLQGTSKYLWYQLSWNQESLCLPLSEVEKLLQFSALPSIARKTK